MAGEVGGFDLKYEMLGSRAIGEGGQAKVYLCKGKADGNIYILKEVDLRPIRRGKDPDKKMAQLYRELDIHKSVDHPHIVKFLEYFESKDQTKMQLILEYCSEGDVMDYIERKPGQNLDENDVRWIVRHVVSALQYLHSRALLHRDIKPDNMLLSSNFDETGFPLCKLADFGVSKELKQGTIARTYTGSPVYMAPEITENETENQYSYPADMWSLGISLYVMLFAAFPPLDMDMTFEPSGAKWDALSEGMRSLISGLIKTNPGERWTAEQVLNSEWLRG